VLPDKSMSKQTVNVIPACRESFFLDRFNDKDKKKDSEQVGMTEKRI
jgi:hypothetical protein